MAEMMADVGRQSLMLIGVFGSAYSKVASKSGSKRRVRGQEESLQGTAGERLAKY